MSNYGFLNLPKELPSFEDEEDKPTEDEFVRIILEIMSKPMTNEAIERSKKGLFTVIRPMEGGSHHG